jgi:hypothetical protein
MGPPRGGLDTSKLPIPDLVVAGGALLSWIFALLSWYKVSVDYLGYGGSATGKGGYQWWPWTIYFLLFLFAGFIIANEVGGFMDISFPVGLIYLGWGIGGTLFTILGIVFKPTLGLYGFDAGVKMGMNWPIWIVMIVLSLVPIAGGYMKFQQAK